MSTIQTVFLTVSCDICNKSATFSQTEQGQADALKDNPWLNSARFVNPADGRKFTYCSDECEAKALGTGNHNKPEPKRIITDGNQASVDLAARAAAEAVKATEALKAGQPVKVTQA